MKKKALILHASAGHGHLKAAKAVESAMAVLTPDWDVYLFDALDFFPKWIKNGYVSGYIWSITRAPFVWGLSYAVSDCRWWYPVTALLRRLFNGLFGARLAHWIRKEKPDVVISTHFMPPEICSALARRKGEGPKTLTVITDLMVHRFWIFKNTDHYAVGCERTRVKLLSEGIDADRITVTGIPVDPKFGKRRPMQEARQRLELDPTRFTVLFTSGGMGSRSVETLVSDVCTRCAPVQAVVVCGNNKPLFEGMQKLAEGAGNIRVKGFVENMDEWMDAADVIVGKAGGLTLSESLAKGKPLFILSPVPGQETFNAEILNEAGSAFWVKNDRDLGRMITDYRQKAELREKTSRAIEAMAQPRSSAAVSEIAIKLSEGR